MGPGTWVMSRTGSVVWDLKSQSVESCRPKKKDDFRLLAEARPVALRQVSHVIGGGEMEKSS